MGVWDSIEIGEAGLKVHGTRLDICAKNMANVDTPNYVRKIPVLNSTEDISFGTVLNTMKDNTFCNGTLPNNEGGVLMSGLVEDPTKGVKLYRPGHPDADKDGYVRSSNVNPMVEMADAMMAQRAYEANLALINISKSMAQRALDIGK
jgi:flagellar basal-body rod protein FlgC